MKQQNLEDEFKATIGAWSHFTEEQKLDFRAAVIAFMNTIAHAEKVPDIRSSRFEREYRVTRARFMQDIGGIPMKNPIDEYQLEKQRKDRVKAKGKL